MLLCIKKIFLSLMMALIERCPSTWHMLIERLISALNFPPGKSNKLSSSGVQVSKR